MDTFNNSTVTANAAQMLVKRHNDAQIRFHFNMNESASPHLSRISKSSVIDSENMGVNSVTLRKCLI